MAEGAALSLTTPRQALREMARGRKPRFAGALLKEILEHLEGVEWRGQRLADVPLPPLALDAVLKEAGDAVMRPASIGDIMREIARAENGPLPEAPGGLTEWWGKAKRAERLQ